MRKIPGEARNLLASYLVFALCLCSLGSGLPGAPAAPAAGRLLRPGFQEKIAIILSRWGFLPVRGEPRWPTPRNGPAVVDWRAQDPQPEPAAFLARAAMEIASRAGEEGGRLLRSEWWCSGGRFRVSLELAEREAGRFLLRLEAEQKEIIPPPPVKRKKLPPPRPSPPKPPSPPKRPSRPAVPRVAIVLDDVGENDGLADFLALPIPLTIAVMPKRPYSEVSARMAAAAGRQVLLHLPLEPRNGQDPGPGTVRVGWPAELIRKVLEENLASVPGAAGANNHMGSLGTADKVLMRTILEFLKEKGLFFLDSRTHAGSVAAAVAREIGLRHAVNGKFLDPGGAAPERIRVLFQELIAAAKRKGKAVGICHANRPHTLAALRAAIPEFAAAGVEVVPLGDLVEE